MSASAYPPMEPTATEGSLDAPRYGATPTQAVSRFFRKYAVFTGRASRSEFWWAYLFWVLVPLVLGLIGIGLGALTRVGDDSALGAGVAFAPLSILVWILATVVPLIGVVVRRFHDANLSGLLALLWLIPYVGGLIILIMCIQQSRPEGRRFDLGASPLYGYPGAYGAVPGAAQAYGQPSAYGQPPAYGQPQAYGQPPASGSPVAPSSTAETAQAVRDAVAASPDHRAAVAAVAAQRGFQVVPDGPAVDRLVAPFGTVLVSYDGSGYVAGISTS